MYSHRFGKTNSYNRGGGYRNSFTSKNRFKSVSTQDISKFINKAKPIEETIYTPINSFADFQIDNRIKENIRRKGLVNPMQIQDKTIPLILEGKDVIGIANTGMGKTLAFLIPLLDKVLKNKNEKVLILAPTRELVTQIEEELYSITQGLYVYSVVVIGGASIRNQMYSLRKQHNFVIATPGRLKDLVDRRAINLNEFKNIVVDEVDRMFDMGFSRDITYILNLTPKVKQSLFFSATINSKVETLVRRYSNNPITISVKSRDTSTSVDQDIVKVVGKTKIEVLHDILIKEECSKVLIFGRTKFGVQKLTVSLVERGFKVDSIHGNKTQFQRQKSLSLFKEGKVKILVATDVASRGLDIPQVTHVINYELPETYDDYVHRIGRTGRANNTGKALTFIV